MSTCLLRHVFVVCDTSVLSFLFCRCSSDACNWGRMEQRNYWTLYSMTDYVNSNIDNWVIFNMTYMDNLQCIQTQLAINFCMCMWKKKNFQTTIKYSLLARIQIIFTIISHFNTIQPILLFAFQYEFHRTVIPVIRITPLLSSFIIGKILSNSYIQNLYICVYLLFFRVEHAWWRIP